MKRLLENADFTIGDVTTVNLTILKGGVQSNVVPPVMTVVYDCRLDINVRHDEFEAMVWHIFLFQFEKLKRFFY